MRLTLSLYHQFHRDHDVDLITEEGVRKVLEDYRIRGQLLFALCERQRAERGTSEDDLDYLLSAPETLLAANEAMEVALQDFCQASGCDRIAAMLTQTRKAMKRAEATATGRLTSQAMDGLIDKATKRAEAEIDQMIQKAESELSGSTESKPSPEAAPTT